MIKNLLLVLCFLTASAAAFAGNTSDDPLAEALSARKAESGKSAGDAPPSSAVDAVFQALSLVGTPYRYGGNTPQQGFDCSGFVNYVFLNVFGIKLPRRAAEIGDRGDSVSRDNLQLGDLVFFNTMRRSFSHVGIYIGKGLFIHAPSSGGVVRMDNLDDSYWVKRFEGARRLLSTLGSTPNAQ